MKFLNAESLACDEAPIERHMETDDNDMALFKRLTTKITY